MKKFILLVLFLFGRCDLVIAQEDSLVSNFLEVPRDSLLELQVKQSNEILVTSASLFEENLAETPGVVTVITKEEIDRRGFRQLSEILATIPGFCIAQNDDEKLITIRGIYNTTNQKYLLLRNGHRMNEGTLDRVTPFYAYSLESVKQIEIIRGGGSSLYGTGAMMAIINIITDDKEMQNIKVSIGNNGQFITDGIYNLNNPSTKTKISAFFRYAHIKGEKRFVPATEDYNLTQPIAADILVDDFPNNIDLGFYLHHKKIKIHTAFRREDYRFSWTANGSNLLRDSTLMDLGVSGLNFHNDIQYLTNYKNWNFTFQHYVDYTNLTDTKSVTSHTTEFPLTRHISFVIPSLRIGGDYQAFYHKNNWFLLFGAFGEKREYGRGDLQTNASDPNVVALSTTPLFPEGKEYRGALYFQGKYTWNKRWTFNLGARLDIADQFPTSFNPRIAVVYQPQENMSFKFLYARAFQAPSHLYRTTNNNSGVNFGTTELFSEIINNIQLVSNIKLKKKGNLQLVYFVNYLNDLIRLEEGLYKNLGRVSTHGIELETGFQMTKKWRIYGNYSMNLPLGSVFGKSVSDSLYQTRNVIDGRFQHIPTHQALLGFTYQFTKDVSFNTYTNWIGAYQTSTSKNPEYQIEDIFLVNATLSWRKIIQGLSASFTVTNLFDQQYKLGEINTQPLPQAGRWWTFSLFYNFK